MKSTIAIISILFAASVVADDCKFSKIIEHKLDLSDSESLSIAASAGDLEIEGHEGSSSAIVRGKVCVSNEAWLEGSDIEIVSGKQARISTKLPSESNSWNLWGTRYAYIDLEVDVPDDMSLNIKDSSGDILVSGAGATSLEDSSGDIRIVESAGPVDVRDSSGDIRIDGLVHELTIVADSSGDIKIKNIEADVLIKADSSGDITLADVNGNAIVERDSSGDISARRIGGDFRVLHDGSGDIRSRDIAGEIDIPSHKM